MIPIVRGICKLMGVFAAACLVAGCNPPVKPIALGVTGARPEVNYDDLAAVLKVAFGDDKDERGFLVGDELKRVSDRLDAQLKRLAVTGPTVTAALLPADDDRIAYWYNARTAWAIKLVLLAECPRALPRRLLETRPFPLDGRTMTLEQIDAILAEDPDWRLVVAAPSVRRHRARLPAAPFSPKTVRNEIANRFNEYVADDERFLIDVERQQIVVHPLLWVLRERLIAEHHRKYRTEGATLTTALLPYTTGSARRRLQDAIGYRCVPGKRADDVICEGDE